jgi:hypothetical protein
LGACTGGAGGAATIAGGGGRRDGENSGRSRVIDNEFRGIDHSGFPAGAPSAGLSGLEAANAGPAIGGRTVVSSAAPSTGPVAAGFATSERPYAIVPRTTPRMPQPRIKRSGARAHGRGSALTRCFPSSQGLTSPENLSPASSGSPQGASSCHATAGARNTRLASPELPSSRLTAGWPRQAYRFRWSAGSLRSATAARRQARR